MDKDEAFRLAEKELELFRALPYEEILSKIGHAEGYERTSESGEPYQVEFDYFFDDSENKNIRVAAMISFSLWTSFAPVSSDFIIAPTGEFIGEESI